MKKFDRGNFIDICLRHFSFKSFKSANFVLISFECYFNSYYLLSFVISGPHSVSSVITQSSDRLPTICRFHTVPSYRYQIRKTRDFQRSSCKFCYFTRCEICQFVSFVGVPSIVDGHCFLIDCKDIRTAYGHRAFI